MKISVIPVQSVIDIKVQSISDVITNSSSEIFTIYRRIDFETIREIVDELLKLAGSDKTFDDLFELIIWTTEEAKVDYADSSSNQDFIDWCMERDSNFDIDCDDPYIESYTIIAKSDEAKLVANKLSNLDSLFEKVESYR